MSTSSMNRHRQRAKSPDPSNQLISIHSRKRTQSSSQRSGDEQSHCSSYTSESVNTRKTRPKSSNYASPRHTHELYSINENTKASPSSCVSLNTFESFKSFSGAPSPSKSDLSVSSSRRCHVYSARDDDILDDFQTQSCRLTLDDTSYLCSTIMTAKRGQLMIQHSKATAKACCELAMMLSKPKTRRILLNSGDDHISDRSSSNALESVLNIFDCFPHTHHLHSTQTESKSFHFHSNRTRYSRTSTLVVNHSQSNTVQTSHSSNDYDLVVAYALSTIAYILSLDCTMHKTLSVSKTREATQRIQTILLSHHGFLNALSRVIFDDVLVKRVLQAQQGVSEHKDDIGKDDFSSEKKIPSLPSKQEPIKSEVTSTPTILLKDPTLAGRRRARKMRETPLSVSNPCNDFGFPSDEKFSDDISKQDSSTQTENSFLAYLGKVLNQVFIEPEDESSILESGKDSECFFCKEFYSFRLERGKRNFIERKLQPSMIALLALNKIVTGFQDCGEEENEKDCYGSDNSPNSGSPLDEGANTVPNYENTDRDEVELTNMKNPLIFKNVMLRQSESLGYLATAMTQALQSVYNFLGAADSSKLHPSTLFIGTTVCDCRRCFRFLQEKISILSTILDGACCLSDPNRKLICDSEKLDDEKNCPVHEPFTVRLLIFASKLIEVTSVLSTRIENEPSNSALCDALCDVLTSVLRTLTSLTHDNELAAKHIVAYLDKGRHTSGICLLIHLLNKIIQAQNDATGRTFNNIGKKMKEKQMQFFYDCVIFTMNTLTNLAESSSCHEVRKAFLDMNIDGKQSALAWLAHWAIAQTDSFRDIVDCNEGLENETTHDKSRNDSKMDRSEGESLVTAGNCFILLACLMRGSFQDADCAGRDMSKDEVFKEILQIRSIISSQFPGNEVTEKGMIEFIVKTLKAFCNYYHYSIGELSVAVIAPVTRIISELENMV